MHNSSPHTSQPDPLGTSTALGQRLVDTPRPVSGHGLAWHVQAAHIGDHTALMVAALRAADR